jgi:hypothetical protein
MTIFNRVTKIVIAGVLSVGAITIASAAGFNKDRGAQVAVLGGGYCSERPWICDRGEGWTAGTTSHAIRAGHPHIVAEHRNHRGPSVGDLISTLRAKISEITSACGSRLISGYRPGARVAGSGHPSLHSVYPARAADVEGNPSCIYSHLQGWSGGYSIDYGHVRHVHISYSPPGTGYLAGMEWHARFAHYGSGHRGYAHRHHRYASR